MLATSARVVPHIIRAACSLPRGTTFTWLPSTVASTCSVSASDISPSLPFAVSKPPTIATCTPAGISTGYLPTRDIGSLPSEYAAQDLAANIGSAGLGIAHHASRRGQNGNTEAGIDPRQFLDLRIDAPAGLRYPSDLLDHRLALLVLQLDAQLRHAAAQLLGREAANEALALQHIQHLRPQLGRRSHTRRMPRALRVTDAGQHIAQGIGK